MKTKTRKNARDNRDNRDNRTDGTKPPTTIEEMRAACAAPKKVMAPRGSMPTNFVRVVYQLEDTEWNNKCAQAVVAFLENMPKPEGRSAVIKMEKIHMETFEFLANKPPTDN